MISRKLTVALAAFGLAGASFAQVGAFKYTANPSDSAQDASAGRIDRIDSTYDSAKNELSWKADFSSTNGKLPDAFWLVVSNGPDPKGVAGQLAIFYLDATTSVPKLTAYGYNGANGYTSFMDGSPANGTQSPDRIATSVGTTNFAKSITVTNNGDKRTLGFTADVSGVNSFKPANSGSSAWEGAKYGDKVGVWFHPVASTKTSYDNMGYLKTFDPGHQGWYDASHQGTTPVPEPASLAVIGVGLLGVARRRKAKKSA